MDVIIVWLRQDLRLIDNPAMHAAVAAGAHLIPVYILDEISHNPWPLGGAQRWWLHQSLWDLQAQFAQHKIPLILRRGATQQVLLELIQASKATAVYWNRCYEPFAIARDKKLKQNLAQQGITVKTFNSALLQEPWEIMTDANGYYKVFTRYWQRCLREWQPTLPLPKPKFKSAGAKLQSDHLEQWNLLPSKPDWSQGLKQTWQPGEKGAVKALTQFIKDKIQDYSEGRDYPSQSVTSRLSAHLHFGEISPRQIWHALQCAGVEKDHRFCTELGWREFCYYTLYHFPELPTQPLVSKFANFAWADDAKLLRAWQKGRTGYPIVDAGMRELWHTGTMHNRVRMIVGSFLTKHLLQDWQQGARWFWDTLVDADLASNSFNWQWVAGCGADAMPYFRIFNPILQGEKFDAQGLYIRQWLSELKAVPTRYIHTPWLAPSPCKDYPTPIVDHAAARERALLRYKQLKPK